MLLWLRLRLGAVQIHYIRWCNPRMLLIACVPHTCISTKFSAALFHTHIYWIYNSTHIFHRTSCCIWSGNWLIMSPVSIPFKLVAKTSFYETCSSSAKIWSQPHHSRRPNSGLPCWMRLKQRKVKCWSVLGKTASRWCECWQPTDGHHHLHQALDLQHNPPLPLPPHSVRRI